ncbi:hypothetical protein [Halobacteriovorax sp.]|uniref:hypothetical protein n=1 Tax=Halobacteriovorax sp. TaxID=2020862 RepID=UPI0035646E82
MEFKLKVFALLYFCLNCTLKAQVNIDIGASREEIDIAVTYISELKAIYRRVGVNASIVTIPNTRADQFLKKSNVDAIAIKTSNYKATHADLIRINVPIYENVHFRLYALKSELPRIKKLARPYTITSHGCLGCSEYIEKYKLSITNYQRDLKSCFNVLLRNRADLALLPDAVIGKDHLEDVVAFDNRVLTTTYYHYIHKRIAHLKSKIEAEFRKSVASGAFIPKKLVKEN